ncbi:helix-turn-helix transcriptional regulator [Raineyella fluvialis]|uniref:Uncharacterized protein n=1 Tax=Raineyella fluvialis TaxID=2662261 RepID=A0A5Q2FGS7_9ACTN|nr:hypothetical protein [Raineyella fluvialis]QGF24313.1 hypothetical protein Rai3103_12305 [Raineyella fluvialis]
MRKTEPDADMSATVAMGPLPAAIATPLSSARAAVLAQLAEADGQPLRAQEIAKALGQHVNTTREHLEGLVADHLAEATTEKPRGRGRPATLYRSLPGASMSPIGRQYAALADVLVEQVLESVDNPQQAAFRAGQRWGRKLLDGVPEGAPRRRRWIDSSPRSVSPRSAPPRVSGTCIAVRCWRRLDDIPRLSATCIEGSSRPCSRDWGSLRTCGSSPSASLAPA